MRSDAAKRADGRDLNRWLVGTCALSRTETIRLPPLVVSLLARRRRWRERGREGGRGVDSRKVAWYISCVSLLNRSQSPVRLESELVSNPPHSKHSFSSSLVWGSIWRECNWLPLRLPLLLPLHYTCTYLFFFVCVSENVPSARLGQVRSGQAKPTTTKR